MILNSVPIDERYQLSIDSFRCEEEPIVASFLQKDALMLYQTGTAVSRLFFNSDKHLVGYYTLFNDHVYIHRDLIRQHNWDLPQDLDEFPALKLHFFGIDSRFQNQGYGTFMMAHVGQACDDILKKSGCNFLVVEALETAVGFYEKIGFIPYRTRRELLANFETAILTDMVYKLPSPDPRFSPFAPQQKSQPASAG